MREREKLKILLRHWIQHNKGHIQELGEWAGRAKGFEGVADNILMAAKQLEEANRFLAMALKELEAKENVSG